MTVDMKWAALPLPDDVAQMKAAGFYEDCRDAIANHLSGHLTEGMRHRLELELERLNYLPLSEYPYTDEEALKLLDETFTDFKPEELRELVNSRAADWLYIKGVRHFHRRFIANIITTRSDYEARQKHPAEGSQEEKNRRKRVAENVSVMKEKGRRAARIAIRQTVRLKPEAVRPDVPLRVHLPIPKPCGHQSDIQILALSHPEGAVIAPESAHQRTVCYPAVPAGDEFWVEYSYVNRLNYVNPDPAKAIAELPGDFSEWLCEEAPDILFTPLMCQISAEIQKGETNPLKKARNAYDFVTTQVKYSYMREYAVLDTICDYAARNLKGDCGVQAILFITLCRLAGVPARWQSGFAADPEDTGCHDWAEFYVNPYGWLHADPSFGGSAFRAGELERWNYYFGNLDIYRMVANDQTNSVLVPPKTYFRDDPTDNQRGELEYPDQPVLPFQFSHSETILEFTELDE